MISFIDGPLRVDLRNPSLGNSLEVDTKLTIKRTMSYKAFSFIQTPETYKLLLTWVSIQALGREALINFLRLTMGKEITYIDHIGDTWLGKILTSPEQITQEHNEMHSFNLEFEGIKQ